MLSKLFRVALFFPGGYWAYLLFAGELGADPAKNLNHRTGEMALYFLLLNLAVGAAIAFAVRFPSWLRFLLTNRRWLGVMTFIYLVFHLFFYFVLESFAPQAFEQLYTKLYLSLGLGAWFLMLVLAVTSNSFSVRKLGGRNWKRLHRLVYFATFLVTMHVMLIEKADLKKFGTLFVLLWLIQGTRAARAIWLRRIKNAPALRPGRPT